MRHRHRPLLNVRFSFPLLLLLALAVACHAGAVPEDPLARVKGLLAHYQLDEADALVTPMAEAGDASDQTLVLAGRVKEEMADGPAARRYFAAAVEQNPSNIEARCYLARALLGVKDYKAAASELKYALAAAPDSSLPPAMAALYYLQKGNQALSTKYVSKALALDPDSKEAALVQADLQFLKRNLEGAKQSINHLLSTNPADPDGLYMMGIVLFNQKDYTGAQNFLERSTGIHRYAANFLKDLAQVYSQNGHVDKALEALDRVLELSPGDEAALSLQSNLRERQYLTQHGVHKDVGPFHFISPPNMSAATFRTILEIFQNAYRDICGQVGYKPSSVNVWIFEKTGALLPAFYSHVSDEIIISASYYSALDTEDKRKLGRHLIFHEFSHLVLFQALGRPAFSPLALWLMEGLAEYQAGGYDYTTIDYAKTFAPGLLDFSELADYLPVSAVGAGEKREKAYIQAYMMASYLMKRPGGLHAIEKMILGYSTGKSDQEVLSLGGQPPPAEFLKQIETYVKNQYAGGLETSQSPGAD